MRLLRKLIFFSSCIILAFAWMETAAQSHLFNHLTVENGLPGSSVISIMQDADGFMWYGTQNDGLSRYDGVRFTNYINNPGKPGSLSGNTVSTMLRASDGRLWVGTSRGINIYNPRQDNFEKVPSQSLSDSTIYCLFEDSDKNIWVGTKKGLHLLKDKSRNLFQLITGPDGRHPNGRSVRCIFEDRQKNLWVGTQNGLIRIKDKSLPLHFVSYNHNDRPGAISGDYITSILQDDKEQLWISTHDNGLNKYDPANDHFQPVASGEGLNNTIRKLVADNKGNIWIGTQEGLNILNINSGKVTSYIHHPKDGRSISNNSIHSIYQDASQNIWIGTYFGGVNVTYARNTLFQVYQNAEAGSSISNNVISSIVEDKLNNLWIGTEGGGLNYYNRTTGRYTVFKNDPQNSSSISSNLIKTVFQDRRGNIWIGTSYNKGLNMLDVRSKRFLRFTVPQKDAAAYDEITSILEDSSAQVWVGSQGGLYKVIRKGAEYEKVLQLTTYPLLKEKDVHSLYEDTQRNLWVGTGTGLYIVDPQRNSARAVFDNSNKLASSNVNCIVPDRDGFVWVSTRNTGFFRCNASAAVTMHATTSEGLPDNNIWGIVPDDQQNLWLSTDNGISRYLQKSREFINYDTYDGLPGNKFNINAYCRDRSGRIYLGGYNGFVSFSPQGIETNRFASPLRLTGLRVFNEEVFAGDKTGLLKNTINTSQEIGFASNQNVFTIDFALLNFIKPNKNKYAYKLEGFDKQWNFTKSTSATYTNLPSGNYTFFVKAANNDGIWSEDQTSISVHIEPPVWRTWWAMLCYGIVLATALFFVIRFFYLKALFKKEYELQQLKLNFFTNISHEIRTHLTLILAPVEKLFHVNKENRRATDLLAHVQTNATRLLELVTELMDFRKAETNNLPLHVAEENINLLLEEITGSFTEIARQKNIDFNVLNTKVSLLYYDKQQLSKVIFNLLGNAFKFAPENGKVSLEVQDGPDQVRIRVTDNGKGIAAEDLSKIFTNYYQVEDEIHKNVGYGIGLSLSKALTELHKGELFVESVPATTDSQSFTCFTIMLRKGSAHFTSAQLRPLREIKSLPVVSDESVPETDKKTSVLLVEDNLEVRTFIREALQDAYVIIEASNGRAGLDIAFSELPDIVISDVMMPEMNGLQFCDILKKDSRTCHIPVIMLTAKMGQENQLEGLGKGADLYITKPFSLHVLELQMRNLLQSRRAMQQKYSQQMLLEPQNIAIDDTDGQFLKKLLEIIEEHLSDPELGVTLITEKIAMSKPVLYKKLKALTDMSVHDFIVSIRLKKAIQLLEQKRLTISEIAYEVGYSDRKYFSKEFKRLLGKSPTEYLNEREEKVEVG